MNKRIKKKVGSFTYQRRTRKQLIALVDQEHDVALALEEVLKKAYEKYSKIAKEKEKFIDESNALQLYVSELSQDKNILRNEVAYLNKIILALKEQNTNLALEVDRVDTERNLIATENVELTDQLKRIRSRGLVERIFNKEVAV